MSQTTETLLMGKLHPNGRLTDLQRYSFTQRQGRTDLVPLVETPVGAEAWEYDAAQQRGVAATLTEAEQFDRIARTIPAGRLLKALWDDQERSALQTEVESQIP